MTEDILLNMINKDIAKPLHFQQLENSLDVQPFLSYVENLFQQPIKSEERSSDSDSNTEGNEEFSCTQWNRMQTSKQDRRSDKMRLYNFAQIQYDRSWLQNILVSDSSGSSEEDEPITEADLQEMLKMHLYKKKCRKKFYSNPENRQYQYYGAGLLSTFDKFPEHQTLIVGTKKKRKYVIRKERVKKEDKDGMFGDSQQGNGDIFGDGSINQMLGHGGKHYKSKKKALQAKDPAVMAIRRRKIWAIMAKKELGKVQRAKINNHKEMLTSCRRVAQYCMRYWRHKAMQSQKNMKETLWRAKRLTREMQSHWRRCDRVERETRRRMEKEAEEQRKMDVELMEAKRQQRKLNFLITQTELYAHFMSRKLGNASAEEQLRILSQLEEETNPRLAAIDNYNSETVKERVKQNVKNAFQAEEHRTRQFGGAVPATSPAKSSGLNEERPQPDLFKGTLKHYQLKGMNWLANLYDQGINGILADEMGLGKTVQSIAFLCHIAEKYSVWGPFLIISPASTLHNWQQEMARFVPNFKVVPYWGSPQERKILRQFWDQKDLHTEDASFHVVITSYQLVISDFKYFNRIKWQYLILDEAQAIKSTSSMRWKLLLGFSCRNRLLLSGTPIQNSMAELWALLHFIMPTMFDSHDEFNEWFSKDIESHAENKTSIDERHLSRLHMILKPFMLRRIKKDVENELSDKIEVMVYCPLTTRQKVLYSALKKKIRIEDLLHSSGPYQSSQSITSSLMNLVMQFRKVCNHPELFERREAKSPLWTQCGESLFVVPSLVFNDGLLHRSLPSLQHIFDNFLSILQQDYVHHSMFPVYVSDVSDCFHFTRLIGLSPNELYQLTVGGLLNRWLHAVHVLEREELLRHRAEWWGPVALGFDALRARPPVPSSLVFTAHEGHRCVFAHGTVALHSMPETVEHRVLRSRKVAQIELSSPSKSKNEEIILLPEFPHKPRLPQIFECHPTHLPSFTYLNHPKVEARPWQLYASSRAAAWWQLAHRQCTSAEGQQCVWHGSPRLAEHQATANLCFRPPEMGGLTALLPLNGWSHITIPDKETLVTDCGKLFVLDSLLGRLKQQGHRVLIYSQMTRMIDLLEEYMWHRKLKYMRLDGSSKISDRRDMVADFQNRADIFVFLLSTRAGGLGINLTAADTVIFYDSDWNPTVDQQAMDRAHRLGQTKQVTVYRLICKNTIEERILQRAREKSEIQRVVISGGNFKPDSLKPKEVVSLLLDDEEIEKKYRQKQAERRKLEESRAIEYKEKEKEKKRKLQSASFKEPTKQIKTEEGLEDGLDSMPASPAPSEASGQFDDNSSDALVVDVEASSSEMSSSQGRSHGSKRGRPRGSRRGGSTRGAAPLPITIGSVGMKRGPGRPRLRPTGPGHTGLRGLARGVRGQRGAPALAPLSQSPNPFGYYTQDLQIMPLDPATSSPS